MVTTGRDMPPACDGRTTKIHGNPCSSPKEQLQRTIDSALQPL